MDERWGLEQVRAFARRDDEAASAVVDDGALVDFGLLEIFDEDEIVARCVRHVQGVFGGGASVPHDWAWFAMTHGELRLDDADRRRMIVAIIEAVEIGDEHLWFLQDQLLAPHLVRPGWQEWIDGEAARSERVRAVAASFDPWDLPPPSRRSS